MFISLLKNELSRRFPSDALGVLGDPLQIGNELGDPPGGQVAAHLLSRFIIPGDKVFEERGPGAGQHHPVSSPVPRNIFALEQAALFEPVHQPGHIGAVHDQLPAQFALRKPGAIGVKEVEYIKLAGAEVPGSEEAPAGIPDGIRRAQELQEGVVGRVGWLRRYFHTDCLHPYC